MHSVLIITKMNLRRILSRKWLVVFWVIFIISWCSQMIYYKTDPMWSANYNGFSASELVYQFFTQGGLGYSESFIFILSIITLLTDFGEQKNIIYFAGRSKYIFAQILTMIIMALLVKLSYLLAGVIVALPLAPFSAEWSDEFIRSMSRPRFTPNEDIGAFLKIISPLGAIGMSELTGFAVLLQYGAVLIAGNALFPKELVGSMLLLFQLPIFFIVTEFIKNLFKLTFFNMTALFSIEYQFYYLRIHPFTVAFFSIGLFMIFCLIALLAFKRRNLYFGESITA